MVWPEPSSRIRQLIRAGARIVLDSSQDFLDGVDRAMIAANPTVANDPALATLVSQASRANLIHFATACLRNPGAPVPANLGAEPVRMARELIRSGLADSALDMYRIGQNAAWQRWQDIAFGLTRDPQELRELLELQFGLANDFVDATLTGIAANIQEEYDQLTRDGRAECRKVVERILDGAPFSRERAEARLGYPLDRSHTAAIIWSDPPNGDPGILDRVADAFGHAVGCSRPLTVDASGETRWVWVKDTDIPDSEQIEPVLASAPQVRLAIGTTAIGEDGFRRSHLEALATQRMMYRLRSHQRVGRFADVQMVALLTENSDGADNFIETTLGEFAAASPTLQHTVLTYISEQCNASRAAKRLFTHRNTLLHRLDTAQRLLPQPLDQSIIEVAVALQAVRWRGTHTTQEHHNGAVPTAQQGVHHRPRRRPEAARRAEGFHQR
ncbi:hypothetical protein MSIMFB_00555 [Mycobacterium simulans]|uniref:Transcriptional activator protein n=1 Tax=Mycobacterium simulans TaxID=627089 RepID=A0A7Z7IGG0_9MYCO|nr:PucR family transcriptional regulator [Mycobacterium simulans]SOJ53051.1 hypothetical protein MSIMFB_00555 [Mycobacterium simulans]